MTALFGCRFPLSSLIGQIMTLACSARHAVQTGAQTSAVRQGSNARRPHLNVRLNAQHTSRPFYRVALKSQSAPD
jgi:hypothetical protein